MIAHGANQRKGPSARVIAYIDGYNVYYGLVSKGWRRYLWLDYDSLVRRLLRPDEALEAVKLFTALGRKQSPAADARQATYLDALRAHGRVDVMVRGSFKNRPWVCQTCGAKRSRPHEKMTDVALAVEMMRDAYTDRFDSAWVMSADADLVPVVRAVRETFPNKRVCVVPPRGRRSDELIASADAVIDVQRRWLNQSQLPDMVVDDAGRELRRPPEWQ